MSRCPAAQCLSLVVVVVVILSLPQSADDDFSRTELFSFPPYDAELESTSGSGAFGFWQLSPVVTNEYGLEDFDRLHGGEIRPLTSKGVVAPPWRPRFVLISALDGTVQLVESKSEIPLWSFSSGPAIYSSYQAPSDQRNYFIDIGEDWQLSIYFWSDKQPINLPVTVDKLVCLTPKILDGVLILGSKESTLFLLDVKSGRLISSYQPRMSDEEDTSVLNEVVKGILADESNAETILYITRTDYLLQGFDPISNKLLWKLTVSQIDPFFTCDGKEDPGWHLDHFISSIPGSHLHMPSSCSAVVHRPPSVLKRK